MPGQQLHPRKIGQQGNLPAAWLNPSVALSSLRCWERSEEFQHSSLTGRKQQMGWTGSGAVCPPGFAAALSTWNPITESQSWEGAGQITRSNPFMLQMRKPRWSALPKVPAKSEQKRSWGPGLPALRLRALHPEAVGTRSFQIWSFAPLLKFR